MEFEGLEDGECPLIIGTPFFHGVIILSAQGRCESCIRSDRGDHKDRSCEKAI
jgi:hypothetical protein